MLSSVTALAQCPVTVTSVIEVIVEKAGRLSFLIGDYLARILERHETLSMRP